MIYNELYYSDLLKVQKAVPNLEALHDSKVLVTGAGGLIGSAIVDFLLSCNDACQLRNTIYIGARNFSKIQKRFGKMLDRADVCYFHYDALQEIQTDTVFDYIIHAASPANPTEYSKHPVETMLANLRGLNNLLEYATSAKVKRVLYVSSSEVYGNKQSDQPYSETDFGNLDILNPRASYPSAKRAAETMCAAYAQEYGVNTVIVRPGHIYGPTAIDEDTRASSQFFRDVLNQQDIVMKSAGLQKRSYCYVLDCVSAIVTVLLNGRTADAYNVSNPCSVITIRDLAEMIARVGGRKVVFSCPSDQELRGYNLMQNSALTSQKLQALGWNNTFDAEEGIVHTFEIMKKPMNSFTL